MSIFKRIRQILKQPEAPIVERSILTVGPGDICEVSLVTYQVTGRTHNQRRSTVVLTLQDGANLRYLVIEDRENTNYSLYYPIDGRLDSIDEVPMTIDLEGHTYHMEEQYTGYIVTTGKTPFMRGGEQSVWQYQSDDMKLLRIEWLEGRFMLYEGEDVLAADVHVLRSS
jgi:hypothetical protein